MSYGYYCQECWKMKYDGHPRVYEGRTVCTHCLFNLTCEEINETVKKLERKENDGIQEDAQSV